MGTAGAVNVGVAAEAKPVDKVDIDIPSTFKVSGLQAPPGWTPGGDQHTARFTGGHLEPFACGYFVVRGTATKRATLTFPFVTHSPDGTTQKYRGGRDDFYPAQVVYAGTQPSGTPPGSTTGSGGKGDLAGIAIALGLVGAFVAVTRWLLRGPRK